MNGRTTGAGPGRVNVINTLLDGEACPVHVIHYQTQTTQNIGFLRSLNHRLRRDAWTRDGHARAAAAGEEGVTGEESRNSKTGEMFLR